MTKMFSRPFSGRSVLPSGYFVATCVVAACVAASTFAVEAAGDDKSMTDGINALQDAKWDEALQHFEAGLAAAREQKSQESIGPFQFYLGLVWQKRFEAEQPDGPAWLEKARDYYREATDQLPKSAGTWNNLGQVAAKLDDTQIAAKAYQRAISLADANQLTYIVNYADFLVANNEAVADERLGSARRLYWAVIDQQPTNDRAFQGLLLASKLAGKAKLLEHVAELYEGGHKLRAQEAALEGLSDRNLGLTRDDQQTLLVYATLCLGKQQYDPLEFKALAVAEKWARLDLQGDLNQAVRQLEFLHHDPKLRGAFIIGALDRQWETDCRESYSWWATTVLRDSIEMVPRGGWPQEAFTALICSLGDSYQRTGDLDTAERHYRLAYGLTEYHLDPVALLKLANMWARNEQKGKITEFLETQEERLFQEKSEAIAAQNYKRVYEIHRALATIYVYLPIWDNGNGPYRSAEEQIKFAMEDARRFNQTYPAQEPLIEVSLPLQLAGWYKSKKRFGDEFAFLGEWTEYFVEINAVDAANELFRPIRTREIPADIDATTRRRHQQLLRGYRPNGFEPRESPLGLNRLPTIFFEVGNRTAALRFEIPNKPRGLPASELRSISDWIAELANIVAKDPLAAGRYHVLPESTSENLHALEFSAGRGTVTFTDAGSFAVQFALDADDDKELPPFHFIDTRYPRP